MSVIKTMAMTAVLALTLGVPLAGCRGSSSSVTANPTVAAAAAHAKQRGETILEGCVPNGKAMVGSVFNGTATLLTYAQDFKYFKVPANQQAVWACAEKQAGTASIPGASLKTVLEKCFARSQAATNLAQHPFHSAHHPKDTITALFDAAAVCIGTDV